MPPRARRRLILFWSFMLCEWVVLWAVRTGNLPSSAIGEETSPAPGRLDATIHRDPSCDYAIDNQKTRERSPR